MLGDILRDPHLGMPSTLFNFGPASTLGTVLSSLFQIAFSLAAFLAFFWFVWGAFQYIFAGGDKEKLGKARSRITWAIIGLVIASTSFLIAQFASAILQPKFQTPISFIKPVFAEIDISKEYAFGDIHSLGQGVDLLVKPTFTIAIIAVVIYFLIGGVKWLTSGGDKDATSSARSMITHAIIGFVLLMFAFLIFQFLFQAFGIPFSLF